eukprot:78823-Chlamydomonas_euryale.AAC.13
MRGALVAGWLECQAMRACDARLQARASHRVAACWLAGCVAASGPLGSWQASCYTAEASLSASCSPCYMATSVHAAP